jgi:hypothetical protein
MSRTDERLHAVAEMTTYELKAYRRNLEDGLAAVTEEGPTRTQLRGRLAEVIAEQAERENIRRAGGCAGNG